MWKTSKKIKQIVNSLNPESFYYDVHLYVYKEISTFSGIIYQKKKSYKD